MNKTHTTRTPIKASVWMVNLLAVTLFLAWANATHAQTTTTTTTCTDETDATLGDDRNDWTADPIQSEGYMTDISVPNPGPNASGCDPIWTSVNVCIDVIDVSTNGNANCNLQGVYGNIWLQPPPMMDGCGCVRDEEILGGAGWSTGQVCIDLVTAGYDISASTAIGVDVMPAVDPNTDPDCPTGAAITNGFISNVEFDVCIDFTYYYPGEPDAGPDITVGCNATVTIGASPIYDETTGATYVWSTGDSGTLNTGGNPNDDDNGQISVSPLTTTTYTVTVTDSGCSGTDEITVIINAAPADAGGDVSSCGGTAVTIGGNPVGNTGDTYAWSTGDSGTIGGGDNGQVSVSPISTTTYTVTVTDAGGCTVTDDVIVTVTTAPTADAGADATICMGQSATLGGDPVSLSGNDYEWSTGASGTINGGNNGQITVSPAATTTYTVTVTDAGGCTNTGEITITVNANPVPSIAPSATELNCTVTSITLDAGVFDQYLWNTTETTQTISITTPGDYTVTVTNAASCTATATVNITQDITAPTPSITPSATELNCTTTSITLDAGAFDQYLWSTTQTTQTIAINTPGDYTVTVTDNTNGCTATATVNITQDGTIPAPSITPSAPELNCTVTSITLDAGVFDEYLWNTTETTQTISITTPGDYTVTVTDNVNGCTATATVNITQNITAPTPSITPSATELTCAVTSITLDAGVFDEYLWSTTETTQTISITTPGDYTVTVTDNANGCTATATVNITQDITAPAPSITPSATELTCTVTSITLDAGVFDEYLWSTTETTQTISITTPGDYTVTVTDNTNGCTATATVNITQDITAPTPSITPSATELTCTVTSITLDAGVFDEYLWNTTETTQTISITTPGDYTVTVTDNVNGCTATAMVNITQNITTPTPSITPSSLELNCTVTSITLDAGVFDEYLWSTTETTQTISITTPGDYTVTVTDTSNGCTGTAIVNITQNITAPAPSITPSATELNCTVTSITLDAGVFDEYLWSTTETTQTISITTPGDYTVTVTDNSNGCTATATVNITQDANVPMPSITPSATELTCTVTSITLDAGVFDEYLWSTTETTQTISISTPGDYTVTVTDTANGCTATATVNITQNITAPTPSITPSATELNCTVTSITLDAGAFDEYLWSTTETTQTISISTPGDYTVTVTDTANGCTATAMVNITQNITAPVPSITPSAPELNCTVTSITLDAGVFDEYLWNTTETTQTISITTPGDYTVTVTDTANGCTATATVNITQDANVPMPSITPSATELTCAVTSITLDAGTFDEYLWSTTETTQTISITTPGDYTVTVTDNSNGCTATATVNITQNITAPTPSITPSATELTCAVTNVTLDVGVFDQYLWNTAETTQTISITTPGDYTVTVTDNTNGCTATTTVNISQNITPPTPSITPSATELTCAVTSISLDAGAFDQYLWNTTETTQTISISAPGDYTVTVTDATNSCTATATVNISQNITPPTPSITPSATELTCTVTSITLDAGAFDQYLWNTTETTQTISITTPGDYTVTVTDNSNGCTATATANITQTINPPTPSITPSATELTCAVTNISLDAGAFDQYLWSTAETTQTINISTPGDYTVTVTDNSNGCTATATVNITQNTTPPAPSISSSNPELTCAITSVMLDAGAFDQYLWNTTETTQTISISAPGNYTVTVTDNSNGCTATATVNITQNTTAPAPSITSPTTELTCATTSIMLDAGAFGGYLWSTAETTQTISISTPGAYTVTVTDATNGCTATAAIGISQNTIPPTPSISAPTTELTCATTSITLDAGAFDQYAWSTTETTQTISISAPGDYTVTVTDNSNGCTATATINIIQNVSPPTPSITSPTTELTCATPSITLDAGTYDQYAWSTTETTQTISISTPGDYTVTVTEAGSGCTGTAMISITQDITAPTPSITPSATELNCTTVSIMLDAGAFDQYAWSTTETTQTITITTAGDYTVTVTDAANGCTGTAVVTITQDASAPAPSITPSSPELTCDVTSVTLDATPGFDGYLWNTTETTASISISTPGAYTVTVTDIASGCTGIANVIINENVTVPPPTIGTSDPELNCVVSSITLDAGTFDQYLWNTTETTQTISVSTTGDYTVTVTDNSNGCTTTATVNIGQNTTAPMPSITSATTELTCATTSIMLDAGSFDQYAWSTTATTQTISVTTPGDYTVTVTDNSNGCTATAMVSITQNTTAPAPSISPSSPELNCIVSNITLDAGSFDQYLWNTAETTQTINIGIPGNYTVTVTDNGNGCTATATISIGQNTTAPTPSITPSATELTCTTTSIMLDAGSFDQYLWNTTETTQTISISTPGNYTVTVTDNSNGCTATATISIGQNTTVPTPSISAPTTELTCATTSIMLDAGAFDQYAWSTTETTQTISVGMAGDYTVTVTDNSNGCTATAMISITQDANVPMPSITPSATELTCATTSISLDAGVFNQYIWSTGQTTQTININTPGDYTVTVTDTSNGCTATATVNITQNITAPAPSITPSAAELTCSTTSIMLDAGSFDQYAWSTAATTQTIGIGTPGNYTVTVTDNANGCTATATISIGQNITAPTPSITPSATELTCATTSISLDAGAFDQYLWSTTETTQTISVSMPGDYTVTVTDNSNGCTATATVNITQNITAPTPSITAPTTELTCSITSIMLDAGVFDQYAWSTTETTQTISVGIAGDYTVTVTDNSNGCTATAMISITQDANVPMPSITASATELNCVTTSIMLDAGAFDQYLWSTTETTQTINISAPGDYTVTVTDNTNGCTATAMVSITQDVTLPNPSITASATELNCNTTSIMLDAGVFDQYVWSTTETTQTISISTPGDYTVTVTDTSNGCTATAMVSITQDVTPPTPSITPSATELTCVVTSISLEAGLADQYLWSTGETTQIINVSTPGDYTITITDTSNGCTATTMVSITQNVTTPMPSIAASATELNCVVGNITLDAGVFDQYIWNTTETTQTISISTPGDYTVTVTDTSNGCTATSTVNISQNVTAPATPSIAASATELTCTVASATLDAGVYDQYLWSTTQTTQTITATMPGDYTVTVTDNSNGCTSSAMITITQDASVPNPSITASAPVLNCLVTDITLDAGTFDEYLWSTGETTQAISINTPGNYAVTVTDISSSCTAIANIIINQDVVAPMPSISASAPELNCTVTDISLDAGVFDQYLWSTGETTQTISINTPADYIVTVTNTTNGCTATAMATITQDITVPNPSIVASALELNCTVTDITLDAGVFDQYSWSTGETTQTISINTPGDYTVTVTNTTNNCTATSIVTITQDVEVPNPSITASAPVLSCVVTDITLDAGVFDQYLWSTGETTQTISINTPGDYSVTATDISSTCTAIATITINQDIAAPMPAITASAPELNCAVSNIILDAGMFDQYEWSTGETTQTISITAAGDYTVTVTNTTNGCTAAAMATITQDAAVPNPSIVASALELNCNVGTISLNAGVFDQYEWSTGETTQVISTSTPGDYTVTVTNTANNCTATDMVTITQDIATPTPNIIASATELNCVTTSISLNAGVFDQYEWSTNETTQTISINTPGDYTVTVTNTANGCSATAVISISQDITVPAPSITASALELNCSTPSITLDAGSFDQYEWSTFAGTQSISVNSPGTYTVTVTNTANGCTNTASVTITEDNAVPSPQITGDTQICEGETSTLDAGAGFAAYLWTGGETSQSINVTTSGAYAVTVTDADGCQGMAMVNVDVTPLPTLDVINDAAICVGGSITISNSTSNNTSYVWTATPSDPSLSDPTAGIVNVSPLVTTTYEVTATTPAGCVETGSVTITVGDPTISVNGPLDICPNETALLSASVSPEGGEITWWDADGNMLGTGDTWEVTPIGSTSYLAQYDLGGCTVSDVVVVNVEDYVDLALSASPSAAIMAGDEVVLNLDGIPADASVVWSTDNETQAPTGSNPTVSPTQTTTYTAMVTTAGGCVYYASMNIFVEFQDLEMPNAFTPNNDGENDGFFPVHDRFSTDILEFKIFDRWGAVVYDNAGLPWDGTYRGQLLPSDIYVYLLRVRHADGREEVLKGDVALIR